jgi:hypothetical protein
VYKNI